MRTYVSPLGYDSTTVTRPVLRYGIGSGDQVVLLRPEGDVPDDTEAANDQQAREAVTDVRQLLTEAEQDAGVTVVGIEVADFTQAVRDCLDVFEAADGEVVAGFGGGPRELLVPFVLATLASVERVDRAYQFTDIERTVRDVPVPDLLTPVSEPAMETLDRISDAGGQTTLPELAKGDGPSKSTLGRHLDELETSGAIETYQTGKTRTAELTVGGELRLARRI